MYKRQQRGTRQEQLQAAYEMWQKAKAGVEIAEKSYNRVNRLFEPVSYTHLRKFHPFTVQTFIFSSDTAFGGKFTNLFSENRGNMLSLIHI